MRDGFGRLWAAMGYVPVTVFVIAGVSWAFLTAGIGDEDVALSVATLVNPLWYVVSLFVHADWAHFQGNVVLLVPFGVVLTLLTNNRHVLAVALVSHVLASLLRVAVAPAFAVGTSGVAFAFVAATLVRSAGFALQNASTESLQTVLVGLLTPVLLGFLLVAVAAGASPTAHFVHFFAFLFGGAVEAIYVFADRDGEAERSAPRRFGVG